MLPLSDKAFRAGWMILKIQKNCYLRKNRMVMEENRRRKLSNISL